MTEISYSMLKSFAWANGFHAEIHRGFNPMSQPVERTDAHWYPQISRKQHPEIGPDENISILSYALAEEVYDWIVKHKKSELPADVVMSSDGR
jgi:hypothetical protein